MTRQLPPWAALAGIALLASGLRFAFLGSNSLWFDEAWVARFAQFSWQEIIPALVSMDVHPPLYFLLMKAWAGLAGTSELALRLPSAVASVASVMLTYAVLRRMAPEQVGLLGALLVGLSPFDVMAGQEARMYALLEALSLGSTLVVMLSVERGGALRWACYAALAAAMAYTHYLGLLVLAAHGVWIVVFERRRVRAWSLAVGAAAIVYAPWIPSLWHQSTSEYHAWYRDPVGSSTITGLLGLFAFGGSLFHMSTYFFDGTLDPGAQWLVVLPFLALVWRGAAALSRDRRSLALIGFCLALPIGTTFLISFVKPMFYARWFSFLVPFYAMFIAVGVADTAAKVSAARRAVLAGLTAAVLLCSAPVMTRYYFDPEFRPYQWRAAAALVRAQAHPGDALVYVPLPAAIAFRYYFHERHPSLVLTPIEALAGAAAHPGFTASQAHDLAARYPRVWLIITIPFDDHMEQRLLPTLRTAFRFREAHDFRGVGVTRLEAKSSPAPP